MAWANKTTVFGFPGYKPVRPGWFKICVLVYNGNTYRLTKSGFMEKPGIEPETPGLQDIGLSPTPQRLLKKVFVFFLGINQFSRVGLGFVFSFYKGNTQRLTGSAFMEKLGIEPATPGLQGIGLSLHHAGFSKQSNCL